MATEKLAMTSVPQAYLESEYKELPAAIGSDYACFMHSSFAMSLQVCSKLMERSYPEICQVGYCHLSAAHTSRDGSAA